MSERPRALIIGPLPPPPGGVGRQVEAILGSPLAESWRLDVFNTSKPQQEGKPSTVTAWDVAWTLWHLVALPARLVARRPAVALVQATADTGFFRDLALALECRALGVPIVLHWHGAPDSTQFPGQAPWRRALFGFGARLARRVIVLADAYRETFAAHVPADKLDVVPNFVDGAHFAAPARGRQGAIHVVFVGRVGPQKGSDVLLDAVALARARGADVTAVLVGDGESQAAWEETKRHPLVISGAARLTGPLGDERLAEYAAADVFCLPTRADSLPLALLEAMAAGLPAVCSSVGAIPWVLEDGAAGILTPAGDVEAVAEALVALAGEPDRRLALGARARARQRERFDAAPAARQLADTLARARWTRPAAQGSLAPMSAPDTPRP